MGRILAFSYGVFAYLVFFVTFLYAVGFVGDFLVPKTIDAGGSAGGGLEAVGVNLLLLGLFAAQHSVMARQGFKRWWTKIVPRPVERSTYVLLASLILLFLFWAWRPLPSVVWDAGGTMAEPVLWGLYGLGWFIVFTGTFQIDHFDLFGLRQVWLHLRGEEYSPPEFVERGYYKYVRHPLMLGFLVAFWAIPTMTAGHLLFAAATTLYVLVALQLEERDLVEFHGEQYLDYRRRTSMLLPIPTMGESTGEDAPAAGDASAPGDAPAAADAPAAEGPGGGGARQREGGARGGAAEHGGGEAAEGTRGGTPDPGADRGEEESHRGREPRG